MSTVSKPKHHIKMISVVVFVLFLLLIMGNASYAYPYLQLDADPAVYVGPPEDSTVTTSDIFTLYALVNSTAGDKFDDWLSRTYYLSFAIIPSIQPEPASGDEPDLGFFTINGGAPIYVVADMDYGVPPVATAMKDIPEHGIYETYFKEIPFTLTGATQTTLYDVQTDVGVPGSENGGPLYYQEFAVDATGLVADYFLHVDLYTGTDDKIKFAPPSHDVTHTPVPGALLLGLLGMSVAGMKLRKHA